MRRALTAAIRTADAIERVAGRWPTIITIALGVAGIIVSLAVAV